MRRVIVILLSMAVLSSVLAQGKLSPWLQRLVSPSREKKLSVEASARKSFPGMSKSSEVCAFVRISGDGTQVLSDCGVRSLARFGDIHIATIPLWQIPSLASLPSVSRIEANQPCHLLMDSTARHINTLPVYAGRLLPHPFTGKGVVVGVQDIGFDLTHPNFYSSDLSDYRIKAFWDQLSLDTVGSPFPVGAAYEGREALLAYAHSRDGLEQTHGTNTLGMAAGSGYDSPYRGMAWESDICIVSNAVNEDIALIDSADLYKYTTATDALGFKYIFDYAASQGKPCVVSFSEGSHQDFAGDDQLFYEVLDSLTGPGRILLAAAGNEGEELNYFHKRSGQESAGAYLLSSKKMAFVEMKSDAPFTIRLIVNGEQSDTIQIRSTYPVEQPDSECIDTLQLSSGQYVVDVMGYPSCYNPAETAIELAIVTPHNVGSHGISISLEAVGPDADVECFSVVGQFRNDGQPGSPLNVAVSSHNILSPGSAPAVICVGASSYRQGIVNVSGSWQSNGQSSQGDRATFSSIGPTFDGRLKPDVLAPGNYVVSSYSSYYLECHPDARDNVSSTISTFQWNGRTYPWTANAGTSMSCPVAAGAVALWLQAKPDLSPEEAMEAIRVTSRRPNVELDYPNNLYGYGEIDVYRGLLHILGIDGIEDISTSPPQALRWLPSAKGALTLQLDGRLSAALRLTFYSLQGERLHSMVVPPTDSGTVTVALPSAVKGLCVVEADGASPAFRGSMLIDN